MSDLVKLIHEHKDRVKSPLSLGYIKDKIHANVFPWGWNHGEQVYKKRGTLLALTCKHEMSLWQGLSTSFLTWD